MSKYIVDDVVVQNGQHGPYKVADLKDENGALTEKVYIFENKFNKDRYKDVYKGATIEGEIDASGKYKGFTFPRKGGGKDFSATMERKEKAIEKAQDKKADGIKLSGTMRDATLLTVAELGGAKEEDIVRVWHKWRKFLFENYD